ncbi:MULTISPECIES: PadR family transcriptional regulator [unclassified Ornithinimicrobium]|uniref:PadR family transcriptional regulator n=1 Tax=unclassified Ornithinimicrobium TaxID=2615080 RepID=UPI003852584D
MLPDDVLTQHLQELRRGTVVLAALEMLTEPRYGYELLAHLEKAGFVIEGNTLYPLLRRLEKQELLTSEWNTQESRPRKYYDITATGRTLLDRLLTEWGALDAAVTGLRKGPRA